MTTYACDMGIKLYSIGAFPVPALVWCHGNRAANGPLPIGLPLGDAVATIRRHSHPLGGRFCHSAGLAGSQIGGAAVRSDVARVLRLFQMMWSISSGWSPTEWLSVRALR
jgi:hypothetical protein